MKFKIATYFTRHFHFDPLTFNPIFFNKKNMQLGTKLS
jgi:hypothetical protein